MHEKSPKVKLVLLFFLITLLCVPGRVFATNYGAFIDGIVTKAKNVYEDTLSKASNYKNAQLSNLQKSLNNYQTQLNNKYTGVKSSLSGIKNSLPSVSGSLSGIKSGLSGIKSDLSGIKAGISLSGIRNSLAKSGSLGITNSALALAGTLQSKALAGLKSGVPTIALTGLTSNGILNYSPKKSINSLGTILTDGFPKDISGIKIFNSDTHQPSNLWVVEGDPGKVVSMLNNVSFQQYYVNQDGQIYPDTDGTVKVKNSREHSALINSLINADKPTAIFYNESMPAIESYMMSLGEANVVSIGGIPGTYGTDSHHPDFVITHELGHSLRDVFNLTKAPYEGLGIADEEASVISLENLVRYQTGYPLRSDGSKKDDINKDGFPDGDGSYGEYYYSNQSWFNDFLKSQK